MNQPILGLLVGLDFVSIILMGYYYYKVVDASINDRTNSYELWGEAFTITSVVMAVIVCDIVFSPWRLDGLGVYAKALMVYVTGCWLAIGVNLRMNNRSRRKQGQISMITIEEQKLFRIGLKTLSYVLIVAAVFLQTGSKLNLENSELMSATQSVYPQVNVYLGIVNFLMALATVIVLPGAAGTFRYIRIAMLIGAIGIAVETFNAIVFSYNYEWAIIVRLATDLIGGFLIIIAIIRQNFSWR